MVEVFKTNVTNCDDAKRLIALIENKFENYHANFDLEDCDLILRVECGNQAVIAESIISLLQFEGFIAEVLVDDFQPSTSPFMRA